MNEIVYPSIYFDLKNIPGSIFKICGTYSNDSKRFHIVFPQLSYLSESTSASFIMSFLFNWKNKFYTLCWLDCYNDKIPLSEIFERTTKQGQEFILFHMHLLQDQNSVEY